MKNEHQKSIAKSLEVIVSMIKGYVYGSLLYFAILVIGGLLLKFGIIGP